MNLAQTKMEILDFIEAGDYNERADLLQQKIEFFKLTDKQFEAFEKFQIAFEAAFFHLDNLRLENGKMEIAFRSGFAEKGKQQFVEITI